MAERNGKGVLLFVYGSHEIIFNSKKWNSFMCGVNSSVFHGTSNHMSIKPACFYRFFSCCIRTCAYKRKPLFIVIVVCWWTVAKFFWCTKRIVQKEKKNRKRELKKEGKWGEEREEILLFTLEDIKKELLRRLFCPWLTRRFVSYRLETPLMPFTSLLSPTVPPKCCFVLSPPTARTHWCHLPRIFPPRYPW